MMHELGVAFASEDASGFPWTVNRLQPSEHASAHARLLLERFRAITDAWSWPPAAPEAAAAAARGRRCGGVVGGGGAGAGGERGGGAPAEDSGGADVGIDDVGLEPKRRAVGPRRLGVDGWAPAPSASRASRRTAAARRRRWWRGRRRCGRRTTATGRDEAPAAAWTASSTAEEEAWTMSRSRSNTVG